MSDLLNDILKSEKTVLRKRDKYIDELSLNIASLQNLCIKNLREKDKNFLYENRDIFPDLFEEMVLPIKNAKLLIHLSIKLRELFAMIDMYYEMGFGN